jgi:predicted ATPase
VARLEFTQLCDTALGASDYIALAQRFHTIFLLNVPQLSLRERDQARRFITLIDQLYNHRTMLVATAAVPMQALFQGAAPTDLGGADLEGLEFEGEAGKSAELNPIGVTANSLASDAATASTGAVSADGRKVLVRDSLFTGEDEVFAFRRALSRLHEMQSAAYLTQSRARIGAG